MKLLHLGDLHLGRSLLDYDLIRDQEYILDQILCLCREKQVDAVLLCGDIYDKSVPSEGAVRLLDDFLLKLVKEDIRVLMISGNHDSDERLQYGSRLFEHKGIYVASRFEGHMRKVTLPDAYGEVDFYLLPFVKASQVKHFYPDAAIENYEDAVRCVLADAGVDPDRRNVLLAHQFVAGGEDPVLAGSEGALVCNVGTVEKIGASLFSDFTYTALGHIHSPQRAGREYIRYAGSPLKYSLSEAGHDKSAPLVTLGEKGLEEIELLPLKPLRDLRHLKGKLDDLLKAEHVMDTQDFIYVTLTDEDVIPDAMGIIRSFYPNTVRIDYDNAHTREMEQQELLPAQQDRSFRELMEDFYRKMYGCEMSLEEWLIMEQQAREAGVLD